MTGAKRWFVGRTAASAVERSALASIRVKKGTYKDIRSSMFEARAPQTTAEGGGPPLPKFFSIHSQLQTVASGEMAAVLLTPLFHLIQVFLALPAEVLIGAGCC